MIKEVIEVVDIKDEFRKLNRIVNLAQKRMISLNDERVKYNEYIISKYLKNCVKDYSIDIIEALYTDVLEKQLALNYRVNIVCSDLSVDHMVRLSVAMENELDDLVIKHPFHDGRVVVNMRNIDEYPFIMGGVKLNLKP